MPHLLKSEFTNFFTKKLTKYYVWPENVQSFIPKLKQIKETVSVATEPVCGDSTVDCNESCISPEFFDSQNEWEYFDSILAPEPSNPKSVLTCIDEVSGLLGTVALIKGKRVDVFFDTGATSSIISSRIVEQFKWKVNPSNIKIKSANNAVDYVMGVTDKMQVDIQGNSVELSFLITNHDDHPILLGLDYFSLSMASLNPSMCELRFPGTRVVLENNNYNKKIINTHCALNAIASHTHCALNAIAGHGNCICLVKRLPSRPDREDNSPRGVHHPSFSSRHGACLGPSLIPQANINL